MLCYQTSWSLYLSSNSILYCQVRQVLDNLGVQYTHSGLGLGVIWDYLLAHCLIEELLWLVGKSWNMPADVTGKMTNLTQKQCGGLLCMR